MKAVGAVRAHTASIAALEAAPTLATEGIATPPNCEAVVWFFHGGTSATISYYVYDAAQSGWCAAGTSSITGDEAVIQQAAGDRMLAIVSTHGGGTYLRSYQSLR